MNAVKETNVSQAESYQNLRTSDKVDCKFRFIDPPFLFNAAEVAAYPAEVTGNYLLECLRRRFEWQSFADKKLLDLGCGVRFARTICNLGIPFGTYVGVDVKRKAIDWLNANLQDPRFLFKRFDARNAYYNPKGTSSHGADALVRLGVPTCDGASMFSVITHQSPDEAQKTFQQLRNAVANHGKLYFTAFTDETLAGYAERDQAAPGHMSTYPPQQLIELAESGGWRVTAVYEKDSLQQTAFVCVAR
jgi:SAM-dependent methyltransferase